MQSKPISGKASSLKRDLPSIILIVFLSLSLISCQNDYDRHNLLSYTSASGKIKRVRNYALWEYRKEQILDSMQLVMGPLPDQSIKVPADTIILQDTVIDGIRRIRLTYAPEKNDRVPAYLLIPQRLTTPVPGILCLHQTTPSGKGEPAGIGGNPNLHYAWELAKRGYITLAPDYPNFGDYKYDPYSNGYLSATMKGIRNHMAAVDLLQSLSQIDPDRIGCIGHSLGGHNSLFVAAFDKRIKAVVTSCGFTSFHKYYNGDLTGWSHKGYMPRIETVYKKNPDLMPFDFDEVLASIAPRALFINAPVNDSNFEISGVHDCVDKVMPVYRLFHAESKLVLMTPDAPHDFPPEEREAAYSFLDRELHAENQ